MTETPRFLESWFVWRDALLCAVLSAAALGYLGVWVLLKRATFVPLALGQASSFGVVLGYFLGSLGSHGAEEGGVEPFWMALGVALLTALWFASSRVDPSRSVVAIYLLFGAGVLLLGQFLRQDLHDVRSVLFGNAVLVEFVQVLYVAAASLCVLVVHALYYRRFLFVSFDPQAAAGASLSVFGHEALLYGTFALMISVATRAIGALPAFGLMILPAMAGLRLARSLPLAFLLSMVMSTSAALTGYYLSFRYELPTGASMVALSGVWLLVAQSLSRWFGGEGKAP